MFVEILKAFLATNVLVKSNEKQNCIIASNRPTVPSVTAFIRRLSIKNLTQQ